MGRVLIAGFTAALLLLATVLIYLMRGPRSGRDTIDIASLRPPAPPPARRALPPPALQREALAAESPRATTVTRLSGRVMGGDDAAVDAGELEVEIVDESGSRPAVTASTKGRDFQVRLPPGIYTVTARMADLVGKVSGVRLNGREDVQLLLVLQPASSLAGRVLFDGDPRDDLEIRAFIAGTRSVDAREAVSSDGSFQLHVGPGVYDLEVTGHGISSVRLTGVQAPAEGLQLRLQRTATLKGAIGMPPGELCAISDVTVMRGEEELDVGMEIDARCQFEAEGVPAGELLVRASGPGWLVEGRVVVPEQGEPPFLCLNPPCGGIPVARLEITVDASADFADEDRDILVDRGGGRTSRCQPVAGRCEIDGLAVGDQPTVYVTGVDCPPGDPLPALKPGLNRTTVICRRLRRIEAFVRQRGGLPPRTIDVRCGSQIRSAAHSFFVRTTCETTARELQYSLDRATGWRSVALGEGDGPLLVELPAP
jgi:hypothetical protein